MAAREVGGLIAHIGDDGEALCLDRCPLRVAGACDSVTPPRRELEGGVEVFCHRSAGELMDLQKTKTQQECAA